MCAHYTRIYTAFLFFRRCRTVVIHKSAAFSDSVLYVTYGNDMRSPQASTDIASAGWVLSVSVTCMPVRIQSFKPCTPTQSLMSHRASEAQEHGCTTNHLSPSHDSFPSERQGQRVPSENTVLLAAPSTQIQNWGGICYSSFLRLLVERA